MSTVQWLLLTGAPAIFVLAWFLYKKHASNLLQQLNDGRRLSSRLVGRGKFVDGPRQIPVALALSESMFYYENADLKGFLELHWIHEVEYEDDLATGQQINDQKVLRLRCLSQNFEFLLEAPAVPMWKAVLPPHRTPEPRAAYAG